MTIGVLNPKSGNITSVCDALARLGQPYRVLEQPELDGIQRLLPMDETLVLCAVDLCGRPNSRIRLRLTRESVGGLACEMVPHFFHSLATTGAFTLHLRRVTGENHHHLIEASFKALAYALREALTPVAKQTSTKGSL